MIDDLKFTLSKVSKEEEYKIKKIDKNKDDIWRMRNKVQRRKKWKTVKRQLDETEQSYLWNTFGYKHVITEEGRLIKVFKERNVMKKVDKNEWV